MSGDENKRRAWFEAYVARCEQGTIRPPIAGIRYACPCCSYLTLSERGGYEICCLCNWEDDGQDDPRADEVWGGPNGSYSLTQARRNFSQHLIMYAPARPTTRIGGLGSQREIEAKREMIAAFDAMPSAPDDSAREVLWQKVLKAESMLSSETSRKIKEYEATQRKKGSV